MQKRFAMPMMGAVLLISLFLLGGCGDSDNSGSPRATGPVLDGETLANRAMADWPAVDFSNSGAADGTTDSDSDGEVDTNDAVILIETLKALGYDVPRTTMNGIYENYRTEAGYNFETETLYLQIAFPYTVDHSSGQEELQAADWSALETGDLIFIDYDRDFVWDNIAIYLGADEDYGYEHAVLMASDYYDQVLVLDLDDAAEIIRVDISFGYSEVRRLDYAALEQYYRE